MIRFHDREGPGDADRAPAVSDRDLSLIHDGYQLWNEGDIQGLAATCFSEDIEFLASPEWPGHRTYRGREEVTRFLKEEVSDVIGLEAVTIESMDVFGDEVLLALLAQTHGFESGIDFGEVPVYHVARIRDGKVARVRVYLDEGEATEAARAGGD